MRATKSPCGYFAAEDGPAWSGSAEGLSVCGLHAVNIRLPDPHALWFHPHMRLLVVDDDAFVRVLLCLDLPDVELVEVTRVQEAVALFTRRERIDACVVDLRLADGDGLEVVRQA